ncbi:MAG: 50S ribosomal protein L23 [Candidatus Saccharibacteria bacterium]|nr:50S ribosomal protein L23 [Candidatus Saccharibacteria bacterium]
MVEAKEKGEIKMNMLESRATEKAYFAQAKRTYIFPVELGISKQEIRRRVEDDFNVKVEDVRTLIRNGKKTKYSKGKHAYPGTTFRRDKKYAYVTLKWGHSIKVFDEPEDDKKVKEVKTSAKEAKVKAEADKNAGKENK